MYVIEVYGRPRPTWLTEVSDESPDDLPTTTDPGQVARYARFAEAHKVCARVAKMFPLHSFRTMPAHQSKGLGEAL